MDLNKLTIHEIRDKLDRGEVTSVAIVEDILTQLDKTEGKLHAYLEIDRDKLISEAKKKDQLLEQGKRSALLGIPITVKDNICIKGVAAGCASRILEGFISPYQATVAQKLLDNGAILIPRANMDEFAMGSSNENSYYGPACNPWDPERVPGGSSGGSCVAVASSETIAAIGSDTGGSIRQPAALCGVVGFKPTYGRISRYGLIAFASSLDQIGPITKDVTDNAIMLRALSGYDCLDSTSVNYPIIDYQKSLNKGIKGLKLGVPKEYFIELINGMEMDLSVTRYQTFDQLYQYAYRAASVVGLICIEIFGYRNINAKEYAKNLGIALQLTNIIRDVKEDAQRGRIYLPQEDLDRFQYTESELLDGKYVPSFIQLMEYQATRALYYYEKATNLIPPEDRTLLATAEIMKNIYFHLLGEIKLQGYDVFRRRVSSSKLTKLFIAFRTWFKIHLRRK